MRPSFHPRLVNPPFGDPGVFIPFAHEKRAVLFDLGDIHTLSPRDILKISHIFISHTHMDHFFGFDHLLRLFLGREKVLYLYGPGGILKNVEGKLAGYTWNLADTYAHEFSVNVTEIDADHRRTREYPCRNRFQPTADPVRAPFDGDLLKEPGLSVSADLLDHATPCLGFSLQERFHVNILKERVEELGLTVGPWVRRFKNALFEGRPLDSPFAVDSNDSRGPVFSLGALAEKIARITPGQKIAYITDTAYTPSNRKKILTLSRGADDLFIEAVFSEPDRNLAEQKRHLTAHQAGTLAGMAGVKRFTIFHFSPRYTDRENLLLQEAQQAYEAAIGTN